MSLVQKTATVIVAFILVALAPRADATLIVVPNANEVADGASNNAFPFNEGDMRYQQVFAAGEFGGLSGFLASIAFRPDETQGGAFSTMGIDTEIRLSHTTAAPTALSTTFADNIGADETLVFDGLLDLSSDGSGAFDIVIDIDDTFFYNGLSNLLMDIKVFNEVSTTQFDSAGTGLGAGGLASTDRLWAHGVDSLVGSSAGDDGYVTQFDILAGEVPEPGTLVLLGLGFVGLTMGRRRPPAKP